MISTVKLVELAASPRTAYRLARKMIELRKTPVVVANTPGLDEPDIAYYIAMLETATFIVEYGSGGTTVTAVDQGVSVLSVDTDERYVNAVNQRIDASRSKTSRVLLADIGVTEEWGTPVDTTPTEVNLAKWLGYIEKPWVDSRRLDRWPDIVFIDGRFRVACAAEAAIRMLTSGQRTRVIIDDFVDRPQYWSVCRLFDVRVCASRMVQLSLKPETTIEEAHMLKSCFIRDCR